MCVISTGFFPKAFGIPSDLWHILLFITLLEYNGQTGLTQGHIDLFVDQINDFVTVVEIKSTNWDDIKEQNYVKLLGSHRRQVLRYVNKFLNVDKTFKKRPLPPYLPSSDFLFGKTPEEGKEIAKSGLTSQAIAVSISAGKLQVGKLMLRC